MVKASRYMQIFTHQRRVLTSTNPQRGVLTLTLTDPRGGNYLKTDTNPYSDPKTI